MIKSIFLIFIAILCLNSCKRKKHEILSLSEYIGIETNIWGDNHQMFMFRSDETNRKGTYILHRINTDTLYFLDFDKRKVTNKFLLSKKIGRIDDYFIKNNHIYALKSLKGVIVQDINNFDHVRFFHLKDEKLGTGVYLKNERDGIHVNIMLKTLINNKVKLESFYNQNVDAIIMLKDDSVIIKKKSIKYPNNYAEDLNIDLTYISKTNTQDFSIYSFTQSPSIIYSYYNNPEKLIEFEMNSNFYVKAPKVPESKIFDFNYLSNMKYSIYSTIVFNTFRNEIYRSVSHAKENINRKPYSNSWSLIVGNLLPEVKYEILFKKGKYISTQIVPTKKGFAIPIFNGDFDRKDQLILHEYSLN